MAGKNRFLQLERFRIVRTCVSLRACLSSRKVISSAIRSAARASTFFRGHPELGEVGGRSAFRIPNLPPPFAC